MGLKIRFPTNYPYLLYHFMNWVQDIQPKTKISVVYSNKCFETLELGYELKKHGHRSKYFI